MRIYLAARYSRHLEMQDIARTLLTHGHVVTSRWIMGNHQVADNGLNPLDNPQSARFAHEDYRDLVICDLLIAFTEPLRTPSRGGRHVELGIALGMMKRVWIVGPRENVFHCLEDVRQFDTLAMALRALCVEVPDDGLTVPG